MAFRITVEQLMRAYDKTNRKRAVEFVEVFNAWNERFGINNKKRLVHFLAQCWHESGALRYVEELASGEAYDTGSKAKALGNTPEKDGDGQRYKGRGFIQVTGYSNYKAYQNSGFCVGNLLAHPEWLAQKPGHTKVSMWFWYRNNLNALADRDDGANGEDICKQITRRVNGGYNGLSQRLFFYRRFKKEFGV